MQHLKVFQNVVVDVIVPRGVLVIVRADVVGIGDAQAREGDVTLVPNRDRRFAVAMHLHVPFLIHGGHALISALILRPACDVLAVAVGVKGRDDDLLISFGLKRSLARHHFDTGDARVGVLRSGHAFGDPAGNDLILRRAHRETPSAPVRNGQRGLQQNQALGRLDPLRATRQRLVSERVIIRFRVVPA